MSDQPETETEETEIDPILGTDPWLRFDLWSSRVWECASAGMEVAISHSESSGPMHPAAQASFCAAQFAHEIAQLVNPLAADGMSSRRGTVANMPVEALMELILGDEEEE